MKKCYLFLTFAIVFLGSRQSSFAQIVGTDCFLQGQWIEVGINQMAGFGTCSSPGTYHVHGALGSPTPAMTSGAGMDVSYDWGHDGWSAGSPALMGPYTEPGTPDEGWSVQVGLTEYRNGALGSSICTGSFSIPGTHLSYSNGGGRATDNWLGNIAGLQILQTTFIDTEASWVNVTTVLRNTTGAPIAGVWYERMCDPDNASDWGGGPTTRNIILHQNEDSRHMVMVSTNNESAAFGTTPAYNAANSYMAYCTKDCRARCGVISSLAPGVGTTPSQLWGDVPGVTSPVTLATLGTNNFADEGIFMAFNIGTIAAFDSAVVSYAVVFDANSGIDSALPDPQLIVNGNPYPAVVFPLGTEHDTFNVCLYPGTTDMPATIIHGSDLDWSWSHWTWAPATGLSATTGTSVTINTLALPPTITYTITGTDTTNGSMTDCNVRIIYLTILTCNGAVVNSPCEGDSVIFNAPGDSTGATYLWEGPAPATTVIGTTQRVVLYPANIAMNGTYTIYKTVAGNIDTNITVLTVHPLPHATAANNGPLCYGATNTLSLTATSDITPSTFSWTGPASFTSAVQDPTIAPFADGDSGMYRVIVTTPFGCKDTAFTDVLTLPVPDPPSVTAHTPYCQFDAFIPFTITGLDPGGSTLWYTTGTGGVSSAVTPTINTGVPGVTGLWFSQIIGSCEGRRDSIKVTVNPVPAPITGTTSVCQYFTTTLSDAITGGIWSSSDPSIATVTGSGTVYGVSGGTATITYMLPTSCFRTTLVTIYAKPAPPTVDPPDHICQYKLADPLVATGTNLMWYGPGVTPGSLVAPTPVTTVPGVFTWSVKQTSDFGCISDSTIFTFTVVAQPVPPITFDTSYCQQANAVGLVAVGTNLKWYASATAATSTSTPPVPSTANPGVSTYFVTQTINQCESPQAPQNVTILYLPEFTINTSPWICQFDSMALSYDGPPLVGDSYRWDIPYGASYIRGTGQHDKNIFVEFDTTSGSHVVVLTVSDYNGRCTTQEKTDIKVVPAPSTDAHISPNVCLGDTVTLALADASLNSATFTWFIDNTSLSSTGSVTLISSNSNSGGPYLISWVDSGRHIIEIEGFTEEGCKAKPAYDTVDVHTLPNAHFTIVKVSERLCMEDSVQFVADKQDYSYSYKWEPEHFFNNENKPVIWGRVEQSNSMIKLTVTDPFGCVTSYSQQVNPDECCTVWFPNAFTPGATTNNLFRPVFAGFHRFHEFRISNRWGQTIFESANSNPEWDGTYNGVPQDLGTYFYYIKYDCGGKTIESKGDVTLVR